jgi:poly(hydroxyalkanoate) depolymerase family esterase
LPSKHLFWTSAALLGILTLSGISIRAGTVGETPEFGSNPGHLRMFHYRPDTLRAPAPLVVALHGCQQTALDYARQTGWIQQADRWGFVLLLPEQQAANNRQGCFNWFRPELTGRDRGEAGSIRQMIARMQVDFAIDPQRIYSAGLSAGGAMTAVLLADYPDLFAGGAIIAGIPYGCATGLPSALRCQLWGRDLEPAEWSDRVRQATAEASLNPRAWPIVSIWQGESDWGGRFRQRPRAAEAVDRAARHRPEFGRGRNRSRIFPSALSRRRRSAASRVVSDRRHGPRSAHRSGIGRSTVRYPSRLRPVRRNLRERPYHPFLGAGALRREPVFECNLRMEIEMKAISLKG